MWCSSLFISGFFTEVVIEIALSSRKNNGNDETETSDLEFSDDVIQLNQDPSELQVFLDRLNDSVSNFRVLFTTSKFKMPLHNWIDSNPNCVLAEKKMGEGSRFSYSSSCTPPGGRISDEVSALIHKA